MDPSPGTRHTLPCLIPTSFSALLRGSSAAVRLELEPVERHGRVWWSPVLVIEAQRFAMGKGPPQHLDRRLWRSLDRLYAWLRRATAVDVALVRISPTCADRAARSHL